MATTTKTKATKKRRKAESVFRGKRKCAIARASIRPGTGKITVNGRDVKTLTSETVREIITEPLTFTDATKYNFKVIVKGGGVMGQAQACRTAIARAIAEMEGDATRQTMLKHDRSLLVEDPRRVEPKKFKGPKARARFTKSYR